MMLRSCLVIAGLSLAGCAQRADRLADVAAAASQAVAASRDDGHPAWTADCRIDRFDEKEKCAVSLRLAFQSGVVGTLSSLDNGDSWVLVSAPPAVAGRLRIDDHRAIGFTCGPGPSCRLPPQAASLLVQLRTGEKLAIEYAAGNEGQLADRDFLMSGFNEALAKVGGPAAPRRAVRKRPAAATLSRT